jgi:iron complex transport system substrate-binding protein
MSASRFVADDLARPHLLEPPARRIVSLAPSCTESLLAIGAGSYLVGVEEHSVHRGMIRLPILGASLPCMWAATVALIADRAVRQRSVSTQLDAPQFRGARFAWRSGL